MSVSSNVHLDGSTEVIGRAKERYTSLNLDMLGKGGVTIFFAQDRGKMSDIIGEMIIELSSQRELHRMWEKE